MEIQKTKDELLAFLELNTNNTSTLREFIRDNVNGSPFGSAFLESKGTTEEESSSAESEEVEETIEEVREEGRDDEDFIMLLQPKGGKKKSEKKIPIVKQSNAKNKRKCEFCGTIETPMWRRGPTGKGTLCNACGVKWSLKFRKRAGKKPTKTEKARDEPREQRQSTRKKIPSKKSVQLVPNGNNIPDENLSPPNLEPSSSSSQNDGLCCNHSVKKRRYRDDDNVMESESKRSRDHNHGSTDEDSMSDDSPPSSHQLLGKLLNVVEVQLVEEEELERVKKQMVEIREAFQAKERLREKQFEQTRANALNELLEFRREFTTIHSPLAENSTQKIIQSCQDILGSFVSSMKNQLNEMKKSVSNSDITWVALDQAQLGMVEMHTKIESNFATLVSRSASDCIQLEKLLHAKEDNIKNGWAFLQKETEKDFSQMYQKLDTMEISIHN